MLIVTIVTTKMKRNNSSSSSKNMCVIQEKKAERKTALTFFVLYRLASPNLGIHSCVPRCLTQLEIPGYWILALDRYGTLSLGFICLHFLIGNGGHTLPLTLGHLTCFAWELHGGPCEEGRGCMPAVGVIKNEILQGLDVICGFRR